MAVVLKLVVSGDVHRVRLEARPTYEVLDELLRDLWPGAEEHAGCELARYTDEEGDMCRLTRATFSDFLQTANTASGGVCPILRLEVVPPPGAAPRLRAPAVVEEEQEVAYRRLDDPPNIRSRSASPEGASQASWLRLDAASDRGPPSDAGSWICTGAGGRGSPHVDLRSEEGEEEVKWAALRSRSGSRERSSGPADASEASFEPLSLRLAELHRDDWESSASARSWASAPDAEAPAPCGTADLLLGPEEEEEAQSPPPPPPPLVFADVECEVPAGRGAADALLGVDAEGSLPPPLPPLLFAGVECEAPPLDDASSPLLWGGLAQPPPPPPPVPAAVQSEVAYVALPDTEDDSAESEASDDQGLNSPPDAEERELRMLKWGTAGSPLSWGEASDTQDRELRMLFWEKAGGSSRGRQSSDSASSSSASASASSSSSDSSKSSSGSSSEDGSGSDVDDDDDDGSSTSGDSSGESSSGTVVFEAPGTDGDATIAACEDDREKAPGRPSPIAAWQGQEDEDEEDEDADSQEDADEVLEDDEDEEPAEPTSAEDALTELLRACDTPVAALASTPLLAEVRSVELDGDKARLPARVPPPLSPAFLATPATPPSLLGLEEVSALPLGVEDAAVAPPPSLLPQHPWLDLEAGLGSLQADGAALPWPGAAAPSSTEEAAPLAASPEPEEAPPIAAGLRRRRVFTTSVKRVLRSRKEDEAALSEEPPAPAPEMALAATAGPGHRRLCTAAAEKGWRLQEADDGPQSPPLSPRPAWAPGGEKTWQLEACVRAAAPSGNTYDAHKEACLAADPMESVLDP